MNEQRSKLRQGSRSSNTRQLRDRVLQQQQPPPIQPTFVSSTTFQRDCKRQLLAHQVVTNGLLSQNVFAAFINKYCVANGACNPQNPPLQFFNLNIDLQLSFVLSLCPSTSSASVQANCLSTLQNSGQQFGYIITSSTFADVAKNVSALCKTLYPLLQQDGLLPSNSTGTTTSAPTTAATTASPSSAPIGATSAPSAAPVAATSAPTSAPVAATTKAPTVLTTAPSASTSPPTPPTSNPPSSLSKTAAPSSSPVSTTGAPAMNPQTTMAPSVAAVTTTKPTLVSAATTKPSVVPAGLPSAGTVAPNHRSPTMAPSSQNGVNGIGGGAPGATGGNVGSSTRSLSSGGIVGVAAAGLAVLLVLLLFTRRRRKSLQQHDKILPDYHVPIEGDESIYTEGTPAYAASKKGSGVGSGESEIIRMEDQDAMVDTGSIKDSSDASTSSDQRLSGPDLGAVAASSKHVAQYDSVSAAGIALLLKDGNDLSSGASKSSSAPPRTGGSGSPTPQFLEELEAAIDEADWQLVWRLATSVSQKDDLSTLSGATGNAPAVMGRISRAGSFSSSSARKPRPYLDPADEARASQLDELVEKRDWTAVAVTAALFLRQNDPSANLAPLHPRRSFIDFVTGRRVSTAAAAAAAGDSEASSQQSGTGRVGAAPIASPVPLVVAAKTDTNSTGSDYAKKSGKDAASPARTADATLIGTPTKTGSSPGINPASSGSDGPTPPAARAAAFGTTAAVVGAVIRQPSRSQSKKGRIFGFFRRNPSGHVPLECSSSSEDSQGNTPKVFKDDSTPSRSGHDGHDGPPDSAHQRSGSFSSSVGGSSLASMRTELDRAVLRGDWAAVEAISAQVEAMDEFAARRGNLSKTNSSDNEDIPGTPTIHRRNVNISKLHASPSVDSAVSRDEYSASMETSGNSSVSSIRTKLDRAVALGDWQAVDFYAGLLMEFEGIEQGGGVGGVGGGAVYEGHVELDYAAPDNSVTSSPMVSSLQPRYVTPTASSVSSGSVGRNADYTAHLHQRIEVLDKLIKAEQWKGLRVMAGLYEMDEQGASPSRFANPFTSTFTPQPLSYPNTDVNALAEVWRSLNPDTVTPSTVVGDSSVVDFDSLSSGSANRGVTPIPEVAKPAAYNPLDLDSQQVKDWKGLAGVRDDDIRQSEADVSRKLFESDVYLPGEPVGSSKSGQVTSILSGNFAPTIDQTGSKSEKGGGQALNMELRRVVTPSSEEEATERKQRQSLHGAKVLIPFWEELGAAQAPQVEEPRNEGNLLEPPQIQRGSQQGGER